MQSPQHPTIVTCDGACQPTNPGPMGIGISVLQDAVEIASISRAIGHGTNNIAEYTAVIEAIVLLRERGLTGASIRTDSQLVVRQVAGDYTISDSLVNLCSTVRSGLRTIHATLSWIPREQNTRADELSKTALVVRTTISAAIADAVKQSLTGKGTIALSEPMRSLLSDLDEQGSYSVDVLAAVKFGRDDYSRMKRIEIHRIVAERHGDSEAQRLEVFLSTHSEGTQMRLLRLAARGMPVDLCCMIYQHQQLLTQHFARPS